MTVGSYDRLDVRASVSAPITDTLAAKLDVISRSETGYVNDVLDGPGNSRPKTYNDTDRQTARLSVLWEPTEAWSIYATGDVTNDDGGPQSGVPAISSSPAANFVNGEISQARPLYGPRLTAPTLFQDQTFDSAAFTINATYDAGNIEYTGVLGYREFDLSQGIDTDSGPNLGGLVTQTGAVVSRGFAFDYVRDWHNETTTLELRAASSAIENFDWVAGIFLMNEENVSDDIFGRFSEPAAFQFASLFNSDQTTQSAAIFGEGTYSVTDRLDLSVGGRYSRDEKSLSRQHQGTLGLGPLGTPYDASTSDSWSEFTPRVIADYDFTDDISAYVSYSRGFQAGAYQSFPFSPATANEPFDPTTVDSYEVGIRSQFFDQRLTANVTAFRADYKDLPSTITATQGTLVVLTNDVQLQGIEVDLQARPTDNLSFYLSAGFTDDKYERSVLGPSAVPGQTENRLKYVADVTARFGARYNLDLNDYGDMSFTANLTHNGDFFMSSVNTPFAFQEAYTTVGAEIEYRLPGDHWTATLGGRNLTDELYQQRASAGGGGVIYFAPPETYYLRLRYEY